MSDEQIERVARAIAKWSDVSMEPDDMVHIDNSGIAVAYWTLYKRHARAAIEAMAGSASR